MLRVASRRLGVVAALPPFLAAVNPAAAAALVGKRAAAEAKKAGAWRWGRGVGGRIVPLTFMTSKTGDIWEGCAAGRDQYGKMTYPDLLSHHAWFPCHLVHPPPPNASRVVPRETP